MNTRQVTQLRLVNGMFLLLMVTCVPDETNHAPASTLWHDWCVLGFAAFLAEPFLICCWLPSSKIHSDFQLLEDVTMCLLHVAGCCYVVVANSEISIFRLTDSNLKE